MRCFAASSPRTCAAAVSSYAYPYSACQAATNRGLSARLLSAGAVGSSGSQGRASNSSSFWPAATTAGGWEWLSIALMPLIALRSAGSGRWPAAGDATMHATANATAGRIFMMAGSGLLQRGPWQNCHGPRDCQRRRRVRAASALRVVSRIGHAPVLRPHRLGARARVGAQRRRVLLAVVPGKIVLRVEVRAADDAIVFVGVLHWVASWVAAPFGMGRAAWQNRAS